MGIRIVPGRCLMRAYTAYFWYRGREGILVSVLFWLLFWRVLNCFFCILYSCSVRELKNAIKNKPLLYLRGQRGKIRFFNGKNRNNIQSGIEKYWVAVNLIHGGGVSKWFLDGVWKVSGRCL